MNRSPARPGRRSGRAARSRALASVLLAGAVLAGCDRPFEPYNDNNNGP
jgi:hypothetical protein